MSSRRLFASAFIISSAFAALAACGDSKTVTTVQQALPPGSSTTPVPLASASASVLPPTNVTKLEYSENDFIESDRNRDPFRSFAAEFVAQGAKPSKIQLHALLAEFAIADLKLMAIVLGAEPRAMLVDPTGKGWVVKKGEYLGRPDLVHTGGTNGADYELYWRVDRIRDGDIVLIREDKAQPGAQPSTQVLPLHPEADAKLTTAVPRR